MRKLSETMKNITDREDFVKNERLKREYIKEGYKIPVDERETCSTHNFLSREDFVNEAELKAKYDKIEIGNTDGKPFDFRPLSESERCLGFTEFLKNKKD